MRSESRHSYGIGFFHRVRFIIAVLVVSITFLNVTANSDGVGTDSGTCGTNLSWQLENGVLTITGTGTMDNYSTSTGPGWEAKKSAITTIVIGNGVTSIGSYAFCSCNNLTSVTMADTVTLIGGYAFQECAVLTDVTLSQELISIGEYAFSYCRALQTIELPSKLKTIGYHAFSRCSGLLSVDVPNSVTSIGYDAWYLCKSMTTLHLSGSVGTVPGGAFEYCSALKSPILDEGITTIAGRAFCGNGLPMYMESIYIPSTLTEVGAVAFANCEHLTDVYYNGTKEMADAISIGNTNTYFTDAAWHCTDGDFEGVGATSGTCGTNLSWSISEGTLLISGSGPMESYSSSNGPGWEGKKSSVTTITVQGATSIGAYAFNGCTNLKTVTMTDTVTSIEGHAFQECSALTSISFSKELLSIGEYAFSGCRALPELNLPSKLKTIGANAFTHNTSLLSLDVPNSVTSIGYDAWYYCKAITTVHLPGSIQTVPGGAFEYGSAILTVTLDEGITTINGRAFCGNGLPMKLQEIYIPSTLTEVGSAAFANCDSLTDVYYNGTKAMADAISIGNTNTYFSDATWHCTDGDFEGVGAESGTCGTSLTWSIDNGVLTISGTGKMDSYSSTNGPGWEGKKSTITSVVIGSGVSSVGSYAFYGCTNLLTVTMADTVTAIEGHAFQECAAMTDIHFSKELLTIGEYAFSGCRVLSELNLPHKLKTIGHDAFTHNQALLALDVPNSVTSIGYDAWYFCSAIKTLHLPGSIEIVPGSAFEYCMALEEVVLDEGIKKINGRAFCGNGMPMNLKTIYIPSSLTEVGAVAFTNCDQLTDVYFNGDRTTADAINIGNNNSNFTDAVWHFAIGPISPDDPNLNVIVLPGDLQTIEEDAFTKTQADKIVVPSGVESIPSTMKENGSGWLRDVSSELRCLPLRLPGCTFPHREMTVEQRSTGSIQTLPERKPGKAP